MGFEGTSGVFPSSVSPTAERVTVGGTVVVVVSAKDVVVVDGVGADDE